MQIIASAERHIDAPARRVYHYIRDFREHHPRFLPPQFSDFRIETGGIGAGTVHSFSMTLGGRTTEYRVRVGEPEPGRVLIESDPSRRMLTTFTVDSDGGGGSRVRIETRWHTNGVQGLVERLVAPRTLQIGAGTVHSFSMTLGGRTTEYRVRVGEPEPGRVLIESDPSRRMLTTFTVDSDGGGGSRVRIETRWHTNGVQGLVERLVAPRTLQIG